MSEPAEPKPGGVTASSVGRDALLYLPGRIAPSIVQILTITLLASYFSSEEIGHYDLAIRFVVLLATVTAIWLSMAVLRLHAAYAKDGREAAFLRAVSQIRNAAMALGMVAGALVALYGPDSLFGSYRHILPAALFAFIAYGSFEIGLSVLRARRKPGIYSVATSVNAIIRLPFAVLLFTIAGMGITGMMWALGITYLAVYALVVWPATRPTGANLPGEGATIRREILLYGWPIIGTQLLNFFVVNLDRYFLKVMRGDADVGLYAIGSNLVDQPMVLVLQTFALAVIPGVALSWETRGREDTEALMAGLTRIFLLISGPLLALLAVGAPSIFAVFAHDKAAAASVAPWLAVAAFLYGLTYLANLGLHLSKRTPLLLMLTILAMAANAGANWYLIPKFGYDGAGMARVISNGLMVALFATAGRRYFRWRMPWLTLARVTAATLIAGCTVYGLALALPQNLPGVMVLLTGGLLAYSACLLITGEVPLSSLRRLARR